MNLTQLLNHLTTALTMIGILAFLVAIITQSIKDLPRLSELPTSAVALSVSMILCPLTLIAVCQHYKILITWYMIFASLVAAFLVYLVATGSWDKLHEIWKRTKYEGESPCENQKEGEKRP